MMRKDEKMLVSILLPAYNGEKYINEFLNSIEKQTYRPLEIIIGNDCSEDNTEALCFQWINKIKEDKQINVVYIRNKKNLGLAQNISKIALKAKGKYIFLADQDDVWFDKKVEAQAQYLDEHPQCMICLCDRSVTDENLEVKIESEYQNRNYKIKSMDFLTVIQYCSIYSSNRMAIRNITNSKDYLEIPQGIIEHDTFIAIMAAHYGTIDFLYEPLLLYRIHENNLSTNYSTQNAKNILECFRLNYRKICRINKATLTDSFLLEKKMQERYNISLYGLENKIVNRKQFHPFLEAWRRTYEEYKENKIGLWRS